MKIAKNFKKIVACLLAFAVIFTCIGSALATVSAEDVIVTNANGKATDVGIWYTPYNCDEYFEYRFADKESDKPVGYKALLPDGSYGVPFAGNEDIIDFYIEQMAKVGIDFVLFDCTNGGLTDKVAYGWGQGSAGNCWNVNYAKLFAEHLSDWNDTHSWKIRYAVSIGTYNKLRGKTSLFDSEDFSIKEAAEWQAEGVVNMFLNDEEIGDDYYVFDGKPLLTMYNWEENSLEDDDLAASLNNSASALSKFTVRHSGTGEAGAYNWCNNTNANGAAEYDEEVVTVCPGHSHVKEGIKTSRKDGQTYANNWATVLNASKAPRVVMIASFNDYMENTAVFVTDTSGAVKANGEETWSDNYQYWTMTENNIKALREKSGDSTEVATGYVNYALDAEVTANNSNVEGNIGPLSAINDNDFGTRSLTYANQNDDKETYIDFTFASAKKINNVNLYADNTADVANYAFKDVAVEVKVDGAWKRVAELHNLEVTQKKQLVPVYFEAVKATAVRIKVDATNQESSTYASFSEVQIYNNPTIEAKDYTGIAAATVEGTAVSATRTENYLAWYRSAANDWSAWNDGKAPFVSKADSSITSSVWGNVFDGKYDNYLEAKGTLNTEHWMYFEFDKKVINSVDIGWATKHLTHKDNLKKDYSIDVKVENGDWVRVAEVHLEEAIEWTQNGKVVSTITFPDVEAYGVRIAFKMFDTIYVAWSELDAYYSSCVYSYTGIMAPKNGTYAINLPMKKNSTNPNSTIKSSTLALSASTNGTVHSAGTLRALYDNPNNGTRTLSKFDSQNVWLQLNFAAPTTLNTVILLWDTAEHISAKDIAVEVLLPNGEFKRVAEVHLDAQPAKGSELNLYFPTETSSSIRVIANKAGSNSSYFSLSELKTRYIAGATYTGITAGTGDAVIPVTATNFALNQKVTSSNTNWSEYVDKYPVRYVTNGYAAKSSDRAISNYVNGLANFTVNYDKAYTINTIDLKLSHYEPEKRPDEYVAEVLTNDGWIRVASVIPNKDDTRVENGQTLSNVNSVTFTFADIECTAVRVVGNNKSGQSLNFAIVEIETYRYDNVTEYTGFAEGVAIANVQGDVKRG